MIENFILVCCLSVEAFKNCENDAFQNCENDDECKLVIFQSQNTFDERMFGLP